MILLQLDPKQAAQATGIFILVTWLFTSCFLGLIMQVALVLDWLRA